MRLDAAHLRDYLWYLFACARDRRRKARLLRNTAGPVHILFCFVDHFEPGQHVDRVAQWLDRYRDQVAGHRDADGRPPQHTWFYPCEQLLPSHLNELSRSVYEGLGEIELHLHHEDDTSHSLRGVLRQALSSYAEAGALVSPWCAAPSFGFIHGNWALDNSRLVQGRNFCGVNDEITILKELGCYADFTFPSHEFQSEPAQINSIYYATDDPLRPKSYNRGCDAGVDVPQRGDLMLIEGPLALDWGRRVAGLLPAIEDADLACYNPPASGRIRPWLDAGVHVLGRPEWIFVNVHAHSADPRHAAVVLGPQMSAVYAELEGRYNDGTDYVLHYVTAREAYNIVKGAEAGGAGDPSHYRDFLVPPPLNRSVYCDRPYAISRDGSHAVTLDAGAVASFSIRVAGGEELVSASAVTLHREKSTDGVAAVVSRRAMCAATVRPPP